MESYCVWDFSNPSNCHTVRSNSATGAREFVADTYGLEETNLVAYVYKGED